MKFVFCVSIIWCLTLDLWITGTLNGMSGGVESIQNMGLGPNVTLITLNSEGKLIHPTLLQTKFIVRSSEVTSLWKV